MGIARNRRIRLSDERVRRSFAEEPDRDFVLIWTIDCELQMRVNDLRALRNLNILESETGGDWTPVRAAAKVDLGKIGLILAD